MIIRSILLFALAGLAEISGGYLLWLWLREGRPLWVGLIGAFVVVLYGIIPTFQPSGLDFGRVYAAYGGAFIVLSLLCIAARVLGKPLVHSALDDFQQAELPAKLQATLAFLKTLTQTPDMLTIEQARSVLQSGITPQALEDAIAVCILFNITTHCADALDYRMLDDDGFDRAAKQLLKQGYAFGKGATPPRPIIRHSPKHCASEPLKDQVKQMPPFVKRWLNEQPEAQL